MTDESFISQAIITELILQYLNKTNIYDTMFEFLKWEVATYIVPVIQTFILWRKG